MLKELFLIGLALGTANNIKPRVELQTPENGKPIIYKLTSDESTEIIMNSYYCLIPKADIINNNDFSYQNETYAIAIRLWRGQIAQDGQDFVYNKIYILLGGYPYKYVNYPTTEISDYLVNPAGINTNDGEYIHYVLTYDQVEEPENDGPALVSSFSDQLSGYDYYGILIPKDTHEGYEKADVIIGGYSYTYFNRSWINEGNEKGLIETLSEPTYIRYDTYAPFRNKSQNSNYLSNESGAYTEVNDNLTTSTADDNCYYYDALFNNEYFINRAFGVGNYATNIMYKISNEEQNYKYVNLSMYKIADSQQRTTYTQTLNNYYNEIGGFNQINNSFNNTNVLNRITNAQDDRNGNTWKYTNANEFIILSPNNMHDGITTQQIAESHLIYGFTVSGTTTGIRIDAGITDVFTLLAGAFSGFGTFFAIAIIPGITLGTLFLLPLITSLILWLIHLFKRH